MKRSHDEEELDGSKVVNSNGNHASGDNTSNGNTANHINNKKINTYSNKQSGSRHDGIMNMLMNNSRMRTNEMGDINNRTLDNRSSAGCTDNSTKDTRSTTRSTRSSTQNNGHQSKHVGKCYYCYRDVVVVEEEKEKEYAVCCVVCGNVTCGTCGIICYDHGCERKCLNCLYESRTKQESL
ncbi:hypothetical protein AWRI3579_g1078 [Hanseniaspora osmophila]|uniref:Uncharacterized protein n=1 Tax=Hanseniaspora osmophila TaxID=56408 RepID=A0A1E5RHC6_9ASCO|nr:hypothetical protein AWRI3579_g1078 [Hanseniaspora osmophila]